MLKKGYFAILLFLIIVICAVSSVNASDLNPTDEGIGEESGDEIAVSDDDVLTAGVGTYYDLQKAIESNYKNGEVTLYKDYVYDEEIDEEWGINDYVSIDRDIVIYGNNHTIYCNNAQGLYISDNANVAIHDLAFIGEYKKGYQPPSLLGGAIYNSATLYLNNCLFADCMAYNEGGAIYNSGILLAENCVFLNNNLYSAKGLGGAISNDNILMVKGGYFTNNSAYNGGAISTNHYAFVGESIFGTFSENELVGDNVLVGSNKASHGVSIFNKVGSACDVNQSYFNENANSNVAVLCNVISSSCIFANGNDVEGGVLFNHTPLGQMSHPNTLLSTGFSYDATPSINTYYKSGKDLIVNVTNLPKGEKVSGVGVISIIDNDNAHPKVIVTNSDGMARFSASTLAPGNHKILLGLGNDALNAKAMTIPVSVKEVTLSISAPKLTTTYKSAKKWVINVTDETNNRPAANMEVKLKVYTGSKAKTYTVKTNSNGVATFKASNLDKGTHKVVLSISEKGYLAKSVTSSIKVKAKKLYIIAESHTYKTCGQILIRAYDMENDKLVSGVKLQIKIYTGKKYKTFNLVTKKSNVIEDIGVLIETNAFSVGNHKVTVKITSPNYIGSDTGYIKIPKSSKNYKKFTYVLTNGKAKYL